VFQIIEIPPLNSALASNPLIDALETSFNYKGASISKNYPADNTGPNKTTKKTNLIKSSSLFITPSARN
jgi:hypothetical protein